MFSWVFILGFQHHCQIYLSEWWVTIEIEDPSSRGYMVLYNFESLYTIPVSPTFVACHPLRGLICGPWLSLIPRASKTPCLPQGYLIIPPSELLMD